MDISNSGALSQRLEKGRDGGLKRAFVTAHWAYPSMKLYCTVDTGYLHLAAIHGVAPHLAPYHAAHLLTFCLMLVQFGNLPCSPILFAPTEKRKAQGSAACTTIKFRLLAFIALHQLPRRLSVP